MWVLDTWGECHLHIKLIQNNIDYKLQFKKERWRGLDVFSDIIRTAANFTLELLK